MLATSIQMHSSLVYIYIYIYIESLNFRECVEDPFFVESCPYSLLLVDSKSARIQKCRFQLVFPLMFHSVKKGRLRKFRDNFGEI